MGQEMNWSLAPSPDGQGEEQWAYWDDAFTDEEIESIIKLGDSIPKNLAIVGMDGEYKKEIRHSLVNFLDADFLLKEAPFVLHKLSWICRRLNGNYFGLDLTGFYESFQYTTYTPVENQDETHTGYQWHLDKGAEPERPPRKLSLILYLMSPDEYEGGEFQIKTGFENQTLPIKKGRVMAFPSWTLHRVTPITKGIRKSLVIWVGGPRFK